MENLIETLLAQFERGALTRRQLVGHLAAAAALGAVAPYAQGAETPASPFKANGVNHLALRVTDVPRSRDFYVKHLGFTVTRDGASSCFLTAGDNFLALFRGDTPGMDHFCISVEDYEVREAVTKLKAAGLEPDQPGGTDRIYFKDPDGLTVQLSSDTHRA